MLVINKYIRNKWASVYFCELMNPRFNQNTDDKEVRYRTMQLNLLVLHIKRKIDKLSALFAIALFTKQDIDVSFCI